MHVSPVKHSCAWLPRKCDYWTDIQNLSREDRQTIGSRCYIADPWEWVWGEFNPYFYPSPSDIFMLSNGVFLRENESVLLFFWGRSPDGESPSELWRVFWCYVEIVKIKRYKQTGTNNDLFYPRPPSEPSTVFWCYIEIVKIRRYKQPGTNNDLFYPKAPPLLGFPISAPDHNIYN